MRLYLPLFVLIGLYTGARKEAICRCAGLRWTLHRPHQFQCSWSAPDQQATGAHPIPSKLLPHLRRARQRGTEIGFVIHENGVRLKDVKKGFASACRRAGLEGVSPHTLRHTCATWLMQAGVNIWDASGFTGMTVETLQRVLCAPSSRPPAPPGRGLVRPSAECPRYPRNFRGFSQQCDTKNTINMLLFVWY